MICCSLIAPFVAATAEANEMIQIFCYAETAHGPETLSVYPGCSSGKAERTMFKLSVHAFLFGFVFVYVIGS